MNGRVPLTMLALAATLSLLGGPAGAHELASERATRLTEQWAAKRCERVKNCVRSAGRYCYPESRHLRRCTAQVIHRRDDGDLIQCRTMLFWELQRGSNEVELARVGKTRCD